MRQVRNGQAVAAMLVREGPVKDGRPYVGDTGAIVALVIDASALRDNARITSHEGHHGVAGSSHGNFVSARVSGVVRECMDKRASVPPRKVERVGSAVGRQPQVDAQEAVVGSALSSPRACQSFTARTR
jgi:hypothetical protein